MPKLFSINSESERLFLLGFLTLFLELTLIRFLAGTIWNLGFFPNLVLLGVFIGMGTGFVFHHRLSNELSLRWFRAAALTLLLLVVFTTFLHPVMPGFERNSGTLGQELFFAAGAESDKVVSPIHFVFWFVLVILIFTLISQRTAKSFTKFTPLRAYSLDILGSCAGILSFMLMSFLGAPAFIWLLIVAILFLRVAEVEHSWPQKRDLALIFCAVVGVAYFGDLRLLASSTFPETPEVHWSPYQKIEYVDNSQVPRQIFVNGIAHQNMYTAESFLGPTSLHVYNIPYEERARHPELPAYKNVLILGAGSGNDVAAALAHGAEHVDAVEIDPRIADLGVRFHPAKPYSDARVTLTVDDGRAFMTKSKKKYDLIIFALTDSLVKVSPMAQLRLENYLFTQDSITRASELLTADGDLLFYNYYRRLWVQQKIEQMIFNVTGSYPKLIYKKNDFAMLAAGEHNRSGSMNAASLDKIDVPRDDWPFLYLKTKGITGVYLVAMLLVTALTLLLLFFLERDSLLRSDAGPLDVNPATKIGFIAMGIAFLLLETKSVIQFSLLFGTTWLNNSLVFLAILLLVLAANWASLKTNAYLLRLAYLLLFISCFLSFLYPLTGLLAVESAFWRFILASLFAFSPIFFANLIFSASFRDQRFAAHVFGWNLIGATLGGVLEYSSLALGYNALALVVALCYAVSFICFGRSRSPMPN